MSGPWGRAARFYDLQLALERRALDAVLAFTAPAAGDRLLDLATGTGALLHRLAARPGAPRDVVGVDASAAMLQRARAGGLPSHWRLQQGDARRLALPDASRDVVCAAYLLHLLDGAAVRAVLAEAHRVLVPGGRLGLVTVTTPPRSLLAPVFRAGAAQAERCSGIIEGLRPFDPRPALGAAGFRVRGVQCTTRGYPSLVVLATPERTR